MEISLRIVMEKAKSADVTVIVGAGARGKELFGKLANQDQIVITAFFDNREELIGKDIEGIKIVKPCKLEENNAAYIIAVDAKEARKELLLQLKELGVKEESVITYYYNRDYDYMSNLDEKYYQEEIDNMYYERFGKRINWQNPVTYNEKINWEKLNVKNDQRTRLVDKYLVREWVKAKIGESYLTKLYGVWSNPEEINFSSLPNAFVLKLNNGSGRNIIVKDKGQIQQDTVCKQLNEWKKHNFAYASYEFQYRDIEPKIICEEYLEGMAESVYDYNIYCFHGEPEYIWCIKGSHRPGCQASFYNKDWEMQPFSYGYPKDLVLAPKPNKLNEMLKLSRILSEEFKHVLVDWYNLPNGRVLFGEMTFSTWSGLAKWEPEEYDIVFGNLI